MTIFVDDIDTLRFYMKPYYQVTPGDDPTLQAFLDKYGLPECAAAELWALKAVELGGDEDGGIKTLKNASESTSYGGVEVSQKAAEMNAKYYKNKCKEGSCSNSGGPMIVARTSVGGVPPDVIPETVYPQ